MYLTRWTLAGEDAARGGCVDVWRRGLVAGGRPRGLRGRRRHEEDIRGDGR